MVHVCLTSSTSKRSFNAMLCRFFGLPGSPAGAALPRQLAPVTAFGVTIADIMLHGRGDDPRPGHRRLARCQRGQPRNTSGPADVLAS